MISLMALSALVGSVCAGFLFEAWFHHRHLRKIPVRIHVNGTRGKSSVARLIAAGLRGGGIRTSAKTTGTLPRMILPDGRELPIFRSGRTNIIEQKRVVRMAVACHSQALVVECMALQPLLQSLCELRLIQSTHSVITNARADHLDVMGPTRLDVAKALAGTVCVDGDVYTSERRTDSLECIARACQDRGSQLHRVDASKTRITIDELSRFSYFEHAENVALALAVCQSLGVERQTALSGMWQATPDGGAMRVHSFQTRGRAWRFANGFAANDPESTSTLWTMCCERFQPRTRVLVMNCRVDRPDRSKILGQTIGRWSKQDPSKTNGFDGLVVVGTGTDIFLRSALDSGVDPDRLLCLGLAEPDEVINTVADKWIDSTGDGEILLLGVGNIHGCGESLNEYCSKTQPKQPRSDRGPMHPMAKPTSPTKANFEASSL